MSDKLKLKPLSRKGAVILYIILVVLAVLGLILALLMGDDVFPLASVDFKVSRDEALRIARDHLEGRGYNLEGYEQAIVFHTDRHESHFLERTLGVSKANELMRSTIPTRDWFVRWFKPLQKEEFRVWVLPTGKVSAFAHVVPEDAPGARLSQDEAKALAVDFLHKDQGIDLAAYELQSPRSYKEEHRTDHTFIWQQKDFDVEGAKLQLGVSIGGKEVGVYISTKLKVPEEFSRSFAKERSHASLLTNVSIGFMVALVLCGVLVTLWAYKYRALAMKSVLIVAGFLLVLGVAYMFNYLPIIKSGYPTSQRMGTYFFNRLFDFLGYRALFLGAFVVAALAGVPAARAVWGSGRKILPKSGDRWISLAASSSRGVLLAFGGLGYTFLFYLVATRLGAWTPLREPYRNLLGTRFPFLEPLLSGAGAAAAEETLFRLFAISFLLLVTRRKVIALVVPAIIWAFLHSLYLTSPVYLRGIELTIVGVFWGYIFLKFDLLTLIVAHYSFNAIVTGYPLLRSGNPYFFLTGLAVMSLPAILIIPGAWRALLRWKRGAPREPVPEISVCQLADLEAHHDFWNALAQFQSKTGEIEVPRNALPDALRTDVVTTTARVLIAKMEGKIVGYILGRVVAPPNMTGAMKGGLVEDIFVVKGMRRQSIGTMLYQELYAWMQEQGISAVNVCMSMKNVPCKSFWLAQGFRPSMETMRKTVEP